MFELHITCTKDIDKLSIDFADGSQMVTTSKPSEKAKPKPNTDTVKSKADTVKSNIRDQEIDFNEQTNSQEQEIIKPPKLEPIADRKPKIDSILDNLSF